MFFSPGNHGPLIINALEKRPPLFSSAFVVSTEIYARKAGEDAGMGN